jgi:pSer/pThr/pTyr-binding forkhead associated (FHA) protein
MSSSVTIGSRPDCDLVVNVPSVSGHHCRLTRDETGFVLEDLNSTNGTFVYGERIRGAVRVRLTATDTIHLGSHALSAERVLSLIDREPTPAITFRGAEMVIGRVPGCDHVIDLPMISSRHARLFREGDRILIEDLRSSNGTFVNGIRVEGPVVLNPGDEVGLGSHLVTLAADSWTQADVVQPAGPGEPLPGTPQAAVPSLTESSTTSSTSSPATELAGILSRPWRLVALLAQAPLAAFLIVGLVGTNSPAPILFWLGLAAIWFGLSTGLLNDAMNAMLERIGLTGSTRFLSGILALAALCAAQCVLVWLVASNMAALKASTLPALSFLFLAALVGLAMGLVVLALAPRPAIAWSIAVLLLFLFSFLGGFRPTLQEQSPLARPIAGLFPSRWAFEGLLLLEADETEIGTAGSDSQPEKPDLAELYFPAASHRMGTRADALALLLMLIGLSAATVFLSASSTTARPIQRWGLPAASSDR